MFGIKIMKESTWQGIVLNGREFTRRVERLEKKMREEVKRLSFNFAKFYHAHGSLRSKGLRPIRIVASPELVDEIFQIAEESMNNTFPGEIMGLEVKIDNHIEGWYLEADRSEK